MAVLLVKAPTAEPPADQHSIFYTCYNRTRCQDMIGVLVALCSQASFSTPPEATDSTRTFHVILAGSGTGGLCALVAAPAADAVVADCNALNVGDDEAMMQGDLFCPGIRNLGSFEG